MAIKVTFKLDRETKNTYRFQEIDAAGKPLEIIDAVIGTIYVKKRAFGGNPPANITVEVTPT